MPQPKKLSVQKKKEPEVKEQKSKELKKEDDQSEEGKESHYNESGTSNPYAVGNPQMGEFIEDQANSTPQKQNQETHCNDYDSDDEN